MEAVERVDRQPNSFEEVDRILTIVEESKKDFDDFNNKKLSRILTSLYSPILCAFIGVLISLYVHVTKDESVLSTNYFNVSFTVVNLLVSIPYIKYTLIYSQLSKEKKKSYRITNTQATEILREIIPIISRHENWSALRKIEIRLRLSKLDIGPEGILDDSRR